MGCHLNSAPFKRTPTRKCMLFSFLFFFLLRVYKSLCNHLSTNLVQNEKGTLTSSKSFHIFGVLIHFLWFLGLVPLFNSFEPYNHVHNQHTSSQWPIYSTQKLFMASFIKIYQIVFEKNDEMLSGRNGGITILSPPR